MANFCVLFAEKGRMRDSSKLDIWMDTKEIFIDVWNMQSHVYIYFPP